jgi:hypothetical protein
MMYFYEKIRVFPLPILPNRYKLTQQTSFPAQKQKLTQQTSFPAQKQTSIPEIQPQILLFFKNSGFSKTRIAFSKLKKTSGLTFHRGFF